jgi:hypothetical protein
MRQLVARPEPAVKLIRKNLKSDGRFDGPMIDKLLGDLDSTKFAARESAVDELVGIAEWIEPVLIKARGCASLELRIRLDRILDKVKISPERLRQSRAVGTLEYIGTPAAAQLLADLAAGGTADSLTVSAAAASERLRKLSAK